MSKRKKKKKESPEEPREEESEELEEGDDGDPDEGGDPGEGGEEPADAERPRAWKRHDLLVVLGALALLAAGVLSYRALTAPELQPFDRFGLALERPAAWLPPRPVPETPARLAIAVQGSRADSGDGKEEESAPGAEELPYHVLFQSPIEPQTRLEIRIARRPKFRNLRGALSLARVNRYGEVYWAADSSQETIGGRDWVRTRFRYAYKAHDADSPKVATGIEYGTLNGNLVYVVTFHGTETEAERLRALIAPTFSVDANHPAATGRAGEER